ncbi:LYR family protein [Geopyxis carbonaria]|nr:LYR family protein [Geopyxis carbonaria]
MAAAPSPALRREVISIYKELLWAGRDYPLGYAYFRTRVHNAFMARAHVRDEAAIRSGIEKAAYVKREVEALWFLKKYRTMRARYGEGAVQGGI